MRYYLLIAALLLGACHKPEPSVCDTVDARKELSMYINRYCTQVILEYYMMHDTNTLNEIFNTRDLLRDYKSNIRLQSVVGNICRSLDSISTYVIDPAEANSNSCTYKGSWVMGRSDWRTIGQFRYEVVPDMREYRFWRIETSALIDDVDAFIIRQLELVSAGT
jgi:hypothetical protein